MNEAPRSSGIVCPKCKSAHVVVTELEGRVEYACELNGDVDRFCNWKEIEHADAMKNRRNDHSPFLSTFLFHGYDAARLEFEHLYLMGEQLNIRKMITLHKQHELQDVLARAIVKAHPEWASAPVRRMYEAVRREFLDRRLDGKEASSKPLVVMNGVLDDASILARTRVDGRIRLFKQRVIDLQKDGDRIDNIFVIMKNGFSDGVYIPLCEEFMLAFDQSRQETPGSSLAFKRYIVLPVLAGELLKTEGVDDQAIHVLHFATNDHHYYDKVAIAEESFWKKWEFGSRNAPYNPFGKDAGAFWIRTRLSPAVDAELARKSPGEQKQVINTAGQEKFQFVPLTLREALARCVLLGTSINATVELQDVFPGSSTMIGQHLQHVCDALHRTLVIKG